MNLYALIMAGGKGTRFWPESTSKKPKQYLSLVGKNSLLKETLSRFQGLVPPDRRFIVTVKNQQNLALQHSKNEVSDNGIIIEPLGRNTAPCILLSLVSLLVNGAKDSDVVAVVPSDHVILNQDGFRSVVKEASEKAIEFGKIVTIGITPTFPHTGYGYIKSSQKVGENTLKVDSFVEKPDFDTAKEYLKEGSYFWNAGMFVAPIGLFLNELRIHSPDIYSFYEELKSSVEKSEDISEIYAKIPKDSIDYAVMEKSENVLVIPSRFDWNDLGSWDALESVIDKDSDNTFVASRSHYVSQAEGNIIFAPEKFVSLIGVNNLIVVSNEKNLLVLPKDRSQDVKKIVESLEERGKDFLDLL